jgi:hypothetical protein
MNSPNDAKRTHATASGEELDADYLAQLPASRPRLQTLIGVAPAAPIVTGRPESIPSLRASPASSPAPIEASQPSPVSRVRPRVERPELPRTPMASKHTLDAVAINGDASPRVAAAPARPARKGRGALLAVLAAAAVVALVAVRRSPHVLPALPTLAAEPPFAPASDPPDVSPMVLAETASAEPTVATVAQKTSATPPARHKRSPTRGHAQTSK